MHIAIATTTALLLAALNTPARSQSAPAPPAAPAPSPEAVVREMTSPANTEHGTDGARVPEGGAAKPTESWTGGCPPMKSDVTDRRQGCETSAKGAASANKPASPKLN